MTAPIVKVMVANKLPATVLAQVFLLVIAGFAVSLYILPTATGTANGILSFHTSNIPCLRCFLFARRLSAYILGHHLRLLGLSRCANNTCRCASKCLSQFARAVPVSHGRGSRSAAVAVTIAGISAAACHLHTHRALKCM